MIAILFVAAFIIVAAPYVLEDDMPKYLVVPQYLVDAIGPKLSSNENTGRTIAEQIARDENGGTLLQKMAAGESLSPAEEASLPPLMRGFTWNDVGAEITEAVNRKAH